MIQQQLTELEQCLKEAHNPILSYLDSGTPFNQAHFGQMLELFNLTPNKEIIELYQWKPGLKKEHIYNPDFQYAIFNRGSHIEYTEMLNFYQRLVLGQKEVFENRFFPIILMPGLDYGSPILIDLAKRSKTYGQVFYYSPATMILDPTPIYDSIGSMVETIIVCYQQECFTFSKEYFLLDWDSDKTFEISKKLNKKSNYWDSKDW